MTTQEQFDRGADRYDLMVGLNPGYHDELRRAADALAERLDRYVRVVDLACGSGVSTRAVCDAFPEAQVLGLDQSPGMLRRARLKGWPLRVRFAEASAGDLDVDAWGRAYHHGVFTAYLFRNVPVDQRDAAVREAYDLLQPGGWMVVQDYSVADSAWARLRWTLVCWLIIIPLGATLGRNGALYRYLWRSVLDHDSLATFGDRLARAGFDRIAHRTGRGWHRGILHTFIAHKPEEG